MAKANSRPRARKRKRIVCRHLTEYMRMVEAGKVESCEEQKQLVAYVRHVFETEELVIDTERIAEYEAYEQYFPFKLYPWEWFCFTLLMCVFKAGGNPRWSQMLIYVGRGAGKNGFDSFVAFCSVTKVNGIPKYHVDICANSEEQAKTSFLDVHEILESPGKRAKFKKSFHWNLEEITCNSTGSTIKYRTNSPKSKDGLRSGMVIFDEVHAYENWKNIKVFTTGLGKKPHPRRLYTTTDGDVRDGVLDKLLEKSRKILRREKPDNGFLPFICKLDSADEVHDKSKWEKANPSLRYNPDLVDQMETEYEDFLEDPASNADFMTKRMNLPQGNPDFEVAKWDDILATNRPVPDLTGKACVAGIDFAQTTDFISAFLLFRIGGTYYGIHHSWFCKNSRDKGRIKAPLDEWEARGLVTIVDDVEVHPSLVTEWLLGQSRVYGIKMISIDHFRHSFFLRELADIGYAAKDGMVKRVRPSDIMLVQPKINSLFVNHGIVWGDDPAMRWFTNNSKLEHAQHGNYTFGKIEPKSRKTDGFMAYVAAMTVEDAIPEEVEAVIYEPLVF